MRDTSGDKARTYSPAEVRAALDDYLRRRPDLGLDKLLLNLALDPASPFDPNGRRRIKKGFVLVALVAAGLVGTFVYFNFF